MGPYWRKAWEFNPSLQGSGKTRMNLTRFASVILQLGLRNQKAYYATATGNLVRCEYPDAQFCAPGSQALVACYASGGCGPLFLGLCRGVCDIGILSAGLFRRQHLCDRRAACSKQLRRFMPTNRSSGSPIRYG